MAQGPSYPPSVDRPEVPVSLLLFRYLGVRRQQDGVARRSIPVIVNTSPARQRDEQVVIMLRRMPGVAFGGLSRMATRQAACLAATFLAG
jgi:hypothetical protein